MPSSGEARVSLASFTYYETVLYFHLSSIWGRLPFILHLRSSSIYLTFEVVFHFAQKDEVVFHEHSGWSGVGVFGPGDVHHRCCLVFRTPSYPDHGIATTVKLMLRKFDGSFSSQPIDFMYYPEREFKVEHRKYPENSCMKKTPRHTENLTESTLLNPSTTQPSAAITIPTYTYQDIPTNTQL